MRALLLMTALLAICPLGAAQTPCKRCGHSKHTPIPKAALYGAQRAKMKPEVKAVQTLIMKESGNAPSRSKRNSKSSAYGYGQFLNSTWKSVGIKKTDCGVCQIEAIYRYCKYRYGSVSKALAVWNSRKRSGRGGWY